MDDRLGCPVWLKPKDLVKIPQSHFGVPPAIPLGVHANQHVVVRSH